MICDHLYRETCLKWSWHIKRVTVLVHRKKPLSRTKCRAHLITVFIKQWSVHFNSFLVIQDQWHFTTTASTIKRRHHHPWWWIIHLLLQHQHPWCITVTNHATLITNVLHHQVLSPQASQQCTIPPTRFTIMTMWFLLCLCNTNLPFSVRNNDRKWYPVFYDRHSHPFSADTTTHPPRHSCSMPSFKVCMHVLSMFVFIFQCG